MRALLCLLAATAAVAATPDWSRFRGPNGSGVSPATNLPTEFSKDKAVLWQSAVPKGISSPITIGGKVFLTGFEKDDRIVLALDLRTGAKLWETRIAKQRAEAAHPINGFATPTPTSDGKNLFVFFPEIGLLSFDTSGKERWRTPLGPFRSVQGHATSPVFHDGLVFLAIDQQDDSFLAAFDARSGRQRWRAPRPSTFLGGYSTPVVHTPAKGPAQVLLAGALEITAYQAATGERLWWVPGLTYAPASSPILSGDTLYNVEPVNDEVPPLTPYLKNDANKDGRLSSDEVKDPILRALVLGADTNYGNKDGTVDEAEWAKAFRAMGTFGGFAATRLGGNGDVAGSHVRWRVKKSLPYLTAPILYNGVLFVIRDGGILTSYDPANGEVLKEGRLEGAIDKYYASPVAGDGKLFIASENGKVAVVKAAAQWELLKANDLDAPLYATPALTDGRVLVRVRELLYCFGAR